MFQTDIRQVFDFIRCAGDKNALKELTQNDPAFRCMEEDAFDVMVQYANVPELVGIKDDYGKEGKIDMCKGLADWIAEEREAGIETGRETGRQEGRLEGRLEGRREGREESRNETIQTMLAADIDVAIILKAGFTMEEIEKAGGQKKER